MEPNANVPKDRFKRGTTPGMGQDYEKFVTALVAARLFNSSFKGNFDDFVLGINLKSMGKFDDLAIFLKKNQEHLMNIGVQLKHKEKSGKEKMLTNIMLSAKKGDFAVKVYAESAKSEVQFEIDKFVLFTNLELNPQDNRSQEYQIKNKRNESSDDNVLEFLQTNNDNCIFTVSPTNNNDFPEFFEKFLLYTDQKNVFKMEEELKRTLKEDFNATGYSQSVYIQLFSHWCQDYVIRNIVPREPKLNRTGIGKILVVSLLKPLLVSIQLNVVQYPKEWNVFLKAVDNFTVAILSSEICNNWTFPLEDENYSTWVELNSEPIIMVKITEKQHCEQILKAIHILNDIKLRIKLIVFGNLRVEHIKKEVNVLKNLKKLDKKSLEEVLNEFDNLPFGIMKIFGNEKDAVLDTVTPSVLFNILASKEEKAQEKVPKCYIPRKIEAHIIYDISDVHEIIKSNYLVLFCGEIEPEFLKTELKINFGSVKVLKITPNSTIFCNILSEEYYYDKNVQFFKFCPSNSIQEGKFEWILSHGAKSKILNNPQMKEIDETDLSTNFNHKINILCAEPGMGKSTTLKNLHNQLITQNVFSEFISFKDHVRFFKNFRKETTIASILKYFLKITNEATCVDLLKKFYKSDRLCLLFDAIDELDSKYLDNAIACIKKLLTCSVYNLIIWISTRKHLKDLLENEYQVHACEISKITKSDQEKYLQERLKQKNNVKNIVDEIYKNFALFDQNSEILGVPLQLYLITKVLRGNDDKKTSNISNLLILSKLYFEYFHEKLNQVYKKGIKSSKNQRLDNLFDLKKYETVALKVCLDDSDFNSLNIQNYDQKVIDTKSTLIVGIVTNFNEDNLAIFEHQTFAEYFSALYFTNHINCSCHLTLTLKNFIFKPKYSTILTLLTLKLAEKSPLHVAAVYHNFDFLQKANVGEIKYCKDDGGRNVLQIAICSGTNYPSWELCNNDETYSEPAKIKTNPQLENIIAFLSQHCNLEEKDKLFEWSAYEYAINRNDLSIVNILINYTQRTKRFYKNLLTDFCLNKKETILGYSTKYGFLNLLKIFTLKVPVSFINQIKFKLPVRWTKAIHLAVENNQVKILQFLIKKGVDIHARSSDKSTPLHSAAYRGHIICIKELLIVETIDVNSKNENGWTPLHLTAYCGSLTCLQELIFAGAAINATNSNNFTPLHLAAEQGSFTCLQELIANGVDVHFKSSDGFTPLHSAAQESHLTCLQELIKEKAEINAKDNDGWTPLHLAAKRGKLDCLQELLKNGANITLFTNVLNETPLHLAAAEGHLDCLKELIAQGADVNLQDFYGNTPLHLAAFRVKLACVKELLSLKNIDINAKNNDGIPAVDFVKKLDFYVCSNIFSELTTPARRTKNGQIEEM